MALSMKQPSPRLKKAHSLTNSSTRISRCPCRTYQSRFPSTPIRRASSAVLIPCVLRACSISLIAILSISSSCKAQRFRLFACAFCVFPVSLRNYSPER